MKRRGKITKKAVDDALELTTELLSTQASLMEERLDDLKTNNIDVTDKDKYIELQTIKNELQWLKDIHLMSNSEEEGINNKEELSYTAFVNGVSGTKLNHATTFSSNHTAAIAGAQAADKKDDSNSKCNEHHKQSETQTGDMNQGITNLMLTMKETEEAVKWIEENQEVWTKKNHLVPLLDSSSKWEAFSLEKIMNGDMSTKKD